MDRSPAGPRILIRERAKMKADEGQKVEPIKKGAKTPAPIRFYNLKKLLRRK